MILGMTFPFKTRKLVKTHEPTVCRCGNMDSMEPQQETPQMTPTAIQALFCTLRTAALGGMSKCSRTLSMEDRKMTADVGRTGGGD